MLKHILFETLLVKIGFIQLLLKYVVLRNLKKQFSVQTEKSHNKIMIEMGTVVTIVLILILTSLSFVYRYFDIFLCISFRYWQSKGVPCDEPEFYYGNTKELGTKIHPSKFIGNLYDKFKLTGAKICGACFYIFPWAIPLDLEVLRNMMKESNNFDDRGSYFLI